MLKRRSPAPPHHRQVAGGEENGGQGGGGSGGVGSWRDGRWRRFPPMFYVPKTQMLMFPRYKMIPQVSVPIPIPRMGMGTWLLWPQLMCTSPYPHKIG